MTNISYAFFGTGALAESVLATLVRDGYSPKLIVTKPDSKQGRHMALTAPYIKVWGEMKGIPVYQPESLNDIPTDSPLHTEQFDVFIVASYGKIIPDDILALPKFGALNVHPSLLPLYRGASPIESTLLDGTITTGVSIIKLDSEMDHGPILVQNAFMIDGNSTAGTLEVACGQVGGEMLTQVLAGYVDGVILPKEQDHSRATYCTKIEKSMGEILLTDSTDVLRRKFRAFTPWPGVHFFHNHQGKTIRVKVNSVDLTTFTLPEAIAQDIILAVTPEGKKEMSWEDFKRGYIEN